MLATNEVIRLLRSRPRATRCAPRCPGWCVSATNRHPLVEIEACDECSAELEAAGHARIWDDDVQQLPQARLALARALTPRSRKRGHARTRELAAVLREYDAYRALSEIAEISGESSGVDRMYKIHTISTKARSLITKEI